LPPSEFVYQYDMDENGALFFLGSQGKRRQWQNPHATLQCQVYASSLGAGQLEDFVGRVATNCRTQNEPNSYFGVDIGQDRMLLPTCYTIRNRNSTTHVMMNWQFEGSCDKVNWTVLDRRVYLTGHTEEDLQFEKEQKELCQKGQTSTWAVDTDIYREIGF
jgi:hypothetical protein